MSVMGRRSQRPNIFILQCQAGGRTQRVPEGGGRDRLQLYAGEGSVVVYLTHGCDTEARFDDPEHALPQHLAEGDAAEKDGRSGQAIGVDQIAQLSVRVKWSSLRVSSSNVGLPLFTLPLQLHGRIQCARRPHGTGDRGAGLEHSSGPRCGRDRAGGTGRDDGNV